MSSFNGLLPDDIQARLIEIRQSITVDCFAVGDIVEEISKHAAEQGFKVTQGDIHNIVASFIGKSGRTIRYYHETARFFDVPTRAEFAILNFAHFVVARSFEDHWRDVLEYAADNPNVPASALAAHFGIHVSDVPDVPDAGANVPDAGANVPKNTLAVKLLSLLSSTLERINKIMRKLALSDDLQAKLTAVSDDLHGLIPEILQEVNQGM